LRWQPTPDGAYHARDMTTAIRSASPAPSPASSNGVDPTVAGVDPRLVPWVLFLRAHAAVSRTLESELETEQSMSLADYEALLQLAHADGRRLRMSELADRMILTRSGISRLVDRLERDRFVERVPCSTDARGAYAVLTETGYERLHAAAPTHLRGVDAHFLSAIPAEDRDAFVRVLATILGGLGAQRTDTADACD
jgi:DNA-binding MarR family transcriptional regulator